MNFWRMLQWLLGAVALVIVGLLLLSAPEDSKTVIKEDSSGAAFRSMK